jgi:ferredoxin/flavodoxin---NADP+ reductase
MTVMGTEERPLRVAIIGAGPSGFYAADALYRSALITDVDLFDSLPTPYGLLRNGVAPDHQKMKSVASYYERVATKNEEHFRFIGNVKVGKDISVDELKQFYDALVFSYGSDSDKKTGLPGENLEGVHSAREFVAWYNGHPDYQDMDFDLSQEVVAIIGQGNVAIDVARILAKTPDELMKSDITAHAVEKLAKSKIKEIHIIGRRGPVQSAFTELEIREFAHLDDANIIVNPKDLELNDANKYELEHTESNKNRKNYAALQELSQEPKEGKNKKVYVQYFKYPKEMKGNTRVESFIMDTVELVGEPFKQKAIATGEDFILPAGLIFRSIGYKGVAMPGVPFNASWGIIPNVKGRVTDENETPVLGLYTAGWIKRGPSGVLGTNKPCSKETIDCLLEDVQTLTPCTTPSTDAVFELLESRSVRYLSFDEWKIIDEKEIENGQSHGKPREKFVSRASMFSFLDS